MSAQTTPNGGTPYPRSTKMAIRVKVRRLGDLGDLADLGDLGGLGGLRGLRGLRVLEE
jgi:hypothetical protein